MRVASQFSRQPARRFQSIADLRYETSMTELLERAVRSLRGLPPETQDALARILQELVGDDLSIITLSEEEKTSFETSFAQAERGEFATEDEIKAIWAKHGR